MSKKTKRLSEEYWDKVSYSEVDGSFTIVEVVKGKKRALGVAKRNCNEDANVPERGLEIAFYRAAEKLDRQVHPARYRE